MLKPFRNFVIKNIIQAYENCRPVGTKRLIHQRIRDLLIWLILLFIDLSAYFGVIFISIYLFIDTFHDGFLAHLGTITFLFMSPSILISDVDDLSSNVIQDLTIIIYYRRSVK